MGLFKPLWKSLAKNAKNEYTRRKAVKKINDQPFLEEIVVNDESDYVRESAIEQINNYEFLITVIDKYAQELYSSSRYGHEIYHNSACHALEKIMKLNIPLDKKQNALEMFLISPTGDAAKDYELHFLPGVISRHIPEELYKSLCINVKKEKCYEGEGYYFKTTVSYRGRNGVL